MGTEVAMAVAPLGEAMGVASMAHILALQAGAEEAMAEMEGSGRTSWEGGNTMSVKTCQ